MCQLLSLPDQTNGMHESYLSHPADPHRSTRKASVPRCAASQKHHGQQCEDTRSQTMNHSHRWTTTRLHTHDYQCEKTDAPNHRDRVTQKDPARQYPGLHPSPRARCRKLVEARCLLVDVVDDAVQCCAEPDGAVRERPGKRIESAFSSTLSQSMARDTRVSWLLLLAAAALW